MYFKVTSVVVIIPIIIIIDNQLEFNFFPETVKLRRKKYPTGEECIVLSHGHMLAVCMIDLFNKSPR